MQHLKHVFLSLVYILSNRIYNQIEIDNNRSTLLTNTEILMVYANLSDKLRACTSFQLNRRDPLALEKWTSQDPRDGHH